VITDPRDISFVLNFNWSTPSHLWPAGAAARTC